MNINKVKVEVRNHNCQELKLLLESFLVNLNQKKRQNRVILTLLIFEIFLEIKLVEIVNLSHSFRRLIMFLFLLSSRAYSSITFPSCNYILSLKFRSKQAFCDFLQNSTLHYDYKIFKN